MAALPRIDLCCRYYTESQQEQQRLVVINNEEMLAAGYGARYNNPKYSQIQRHFSLFY